MTATAPEPQAGLAALTELAATAALVVVVMGVLS